MPPPARASRPSGRWPNAGRYMPSARCTTPASTRFRPTSNPGARWPWWARPAWGKSTLANRLLGHERQATGGVRVHDARGRHTTSRRELFRLPGGALLLDTPGMRSLGLWDAEAGVAAVFDDVDAVARACRFADCRHEGEPGCALAAAVEDGTLAPERLAEWGRPAPRGRLRGAQERPPADGGTPPALEVAQQGRPQNARLRGHCPAGPPQRMLPGE
jgi:hypothetical protein